MKISNFCPPEKMTPAQRGAEIAALLSAGLIRLRMPPISESIQRESEFELGFLPRKSIHVDPVTSHQPEFT